MRFISTCACEKLIVDKGGAHSLINVMSSIDIAISPMPGTPLEQIPTNAVMPKEWWIFSMWEADATEVGQEFEQIYQVFWPNGDKLLEGKLKFKPDEKAQYNSFTILGFPVGQQGRVKINTWVESKGSPITEPFTYSIVMKHVSETHHPPGTPHSVGTFSTSK